MESDLRQKSLRFLDKIVQDPQLESLDPINLIHLLRKDGIVAQAEYERIIRWEKCRDSRKLALFRQILPSKNSEKSLSSLHKISCALDLVRLKELIEQDFPSDLMEIPWPSLSYGTQFSQSVQYLKDIYIQECEIMKKHWSNLMKYPEEFEMRDMYIDLEIVKEGRRTKESIKDYKELFGMWENRRNYRKIVMEGEPGMGKTTYVHKLVQSWAQGNVFLNAEFELVLIVRLGETNADDNITSILPSNKKIRDCISNFLENFENHRKVLIVLDAFDELSAGCEYFENLAENRKLGDNSVPNITLLITTRVSHVHETALIERDLSLRVAGFKDTVVKHIFQKYNVKNMESFSDTFLEAENCRNPLVVGLVLSLGYVPSELYDLIDKFGELVMARSYDQKRDAKAQKCRWVDVRSFLAKLAYLAYSERYTEWFRPTSDGASQELQVKIHREVVQSPMTHLCCDAGLLWLPRGESTLNIPPLEEVNKLDISFPHNLFLSFFIAHFAADMDILKSSILSFQENKCSGFLSDPFSYFLSGCYRGWKKYVLSKSISKSFTLVTHRWRSQFQPPWVYKPNTDLEHIPFRSKRPIQLVGHKSHSSPSPNHGELLKALSMTHSNVFAHVEEVANIRIHGSSVKMFRHIAGHGIHFENCSLQQSGACELEEWLTSRFLRTLSMEKCEISLTELSFRAVSNMKNLETLIITDCKDGWTVLENALATRQLWENNPLHVFQLSNCSTAGSQIFSTGMLPASLQVF